MNTVLEKDILWYVTVFSTCFWMQYNGRYRNLTSMNVIHTISDCSGRYKCQRMYTVIPSWFLKTAANIDSLWSLRIVPVHFLPCSCRCKLMHKIPDCSARYICESFLYLYLNAVANIVILWSVRLSLLDFWLQWQCLNLKTCTGISILDIWMHILWYLRVISICVTDIVILKTVKVLKECTELSLLDIWMQCQI